MKKILVIGSAVADVIIRVPSLPVRGEDIHVASQEMHLGGCAFNTYDIIRHFGVPSIPFFPVGTGAYGAFIRSALAVRGVHSPIPTPKSDNGCCYCFVEPDGERTFLSYHGAEYRFQYPWFSLLDVNEIHSVYICGLEIEEPTGPNIVRFLEDNPSLPVFFAPGPRLERIDPALTERIFALSPILHLNEEESTRFTGTDTKEAAADALFAMTGSPVLITLGADGCYCRDKDAAFTVPGFPVAQMDTIGAGDSHIGAVMASLYQGASLREAVTRANRISSVVVSVQGAQLTDKEFARALSE